MRKIVAAFMIILGTFAFKGSRINSTKSLEEDNLTIVNMEIDGQPYSFLYDTNAEYAMIDSNALNKHKDSSKTTEDFIMLSDNKFIIKDLNKTINNVEYHTGKKVDGIINTKVIEKTN